MQRLTREQKAKLVAYKERADNIQSLIENLCIELRETVEQVQEMAQEYFDDRSERWQDSEKGQQYDNWIQSFPFDGETLEDITEYLDSLPETPEDA